MQKDYFFAIGKTIRVPIICSRNPYYLRRVEEVSSLVIKAVSLWESIFPPEIKPPHHHSLGHLIRLVAESLPHEKLKYLGNNPSLNRAALLLDEAKLSGCSKNLEEIFIRLHEGLNQLYTEYGEEPFDEGNDLWSLQLVCSSIPDGEQPGSVNIDLISKSLEEMRALI
ncbi:hypothetical protein Tlie_0127 [Thermovirga lienii DSM 17291]|uniref:Uncharacterized protein n=1 Tax=Thermovirga lienii (strain ATCC BAA-1197 / DSM 17291 / Cas60314) TaxID=580340 RepID=G7V5W8_THELD|nr:hypothetical protein [Thermovirga lienii]AER65873.1 hypothetical protein Tlie_0127 [Thermovirga lienii DSM 17291]